MASMGRELSRGSDSSRRTMGSDPQAPAEGYGRSLLQLPIDARVRSVPAAVAMVSLPFASFRKSTLKDPWRSAESGCVRKFEEMRRIAS